MDVWRRQYLYIELFKSIITSTQIFNIQKNCNLHCKVSIFLVSFKNLYIENKFFLLYNIYCGT